MSGLEIFGAIGAVDGVLKLSGGIGGVIRDLWKYEEDQEELRQNASSMKDHWQSLVDWKKKMDNHAKKDILFGNFLRVATQSFLDSMRDTISQLEGKLRPRHGLMKTTKHMFWSIRKGRIESLLSKIEQLAEQLRKALQSDQLSVSLDTNEGMDQGRVFFAEQKQREDTRDREKRLKERQKKIQDVVSWLPKLDFEARHQEICEKGIIEMEHNIFKSAEFGSWRNNVRPWLLSCWADAGAGKTMLIARIIEHLRSYYGQHCGDKNIPVLCVYFNHKDRDKHSLTNVMGSLLKQLILGNRPPSCSEELIEAFNTKWPSRFSEREMCEAFRKEAMLYDRVVIVVDALDESFDGSGIAFLNAFQTLPMDHISILTTSRGDLPPSVRLKDCDVCNKRNFIVYYSCQDCPPGEIDVCYDCKLRGEACPNDPRPNDPSHKLIEPNAEVVVDIAPSNDNIRTYVRDELHKEATVTRPGRDNSITSLPSRVDSGKNSAPNLPRRQSNTRWGRVCEKDDNLEHDVIETICDRANGKFMLAKLFVSTIKVQGSIKEVRKALEKLPKGYSETYQSTMERIRDESKFFKRTTRVLSWVVYARRPLTMTELQHALATDVDEGYEEDAEYPRETIIEDISGLIYVGSDDTVRLDHYTLQEYFAKDGLHWLLPGFDYHIARVSLAYMNMQDLSVPFGSREEEQLDTRTKQYPYLSYSYEYWGYHSSLVVQTAGEVEVDADLNTSLLIFLRNVDRVANFVKAFWYLETPQSSGWEIRKGATALHVAAWFGLTNVLTALAEDEYIDAQDPAQRLTPLMCAAKRGHEETTAKLLELGALVSKRSALGRTAIYEAVHEGRPNIAAILLNSKLDLEQEYPWDHNQTLLTIAVLKNNEEIVKLLLERKANVNHRDALGVTALAIACTRGYTSTVEQLLDHGAEVDTSMANGQTALCSVAAHGNSDDGKEIAQMLLMKDADAQHQDNRGETPAIHAAANGNLYVLDALLEERPDLLHGKDRQGRSLMHAAASSGQLEIAEYLVGKEIDLKSRDHHNRTPLHEAARVGSGEAIIGIVKYLLRLKLDPLLKDHWNRTPAEVAWQNGHTALIALFNKSSPQSSPLPAEDTRPLWSLAKLGKADIIAQRIAARDPQAYSNNPTDPDTDDTPIHCAIQSSHLNAANPTASLSMLDSLLKCSNPSATAYTASRTGINAPNNLNRTPLHCAIIAASLPLTTLLLSHSPAPDLNPIDIDGSTPLWLDFMNNSVSECGIALIAAGANITNNAMVSPYFFAAILKGNLQAVEIIIRKHGAKAGLLQAKNSQGRSGLQLAKAFGWGEIVRVLTVNKSLYYDPGREGGQVEDGEEGMQSPGGESLGSMAMMSPGAESMASMSVKSPFAQPEELFDEPEEVAGDEVRVGREEVVEERVEKMNGKKKGVSFSNFPDVPTTEAKGLGVVMEEKVREMVLEKGGI